MLLIFSSIMRAEMDVLKCIRPEHLLRYFM